MRNPCEQADGLIGDSIISDDPVRKQWQQKRVRTPAFDVPFKKREDKRD